VNNYSKITYDSPYLIKRFSHRVRFRHYVNSIFNNSKKNHNNIKFLDYGTGDGFIFIYLKKYDVKNLSLFAYEPSIGQYNDLLKNLDDNGLNVTCLQKLGEEKFDIILCAEVLEHFTEKNVINNLEKIKKLLKSDGTLIISVPLEVGLSGLLKNLTRIFIRSPHDGLTLKTLFKCFFDLVIPRETSEYIPSHMGFSHIKFEKILLKSELKVSKKYYSPFPVLKHFVNSQVIFECKTKRLSTT
tara:strand:+ start:709 stop:1434 length:726 start_codon:yes stop_codon:yes gene_type:complete